MNERPVTKEHEQNHHGGYSLSSLFLLLALFAVVSANISPLLKAPLGEIQPPDSWTLVLVCGVSGAALGLIVGMQHYRRRLGMMLGMPLGLILGALSGPAVAASMAYPQHTLLISVACAVALLGLAAFFRRIKDEDLVSRKDVYEARLRQWQLESTMTKPSPEE